MKRYRYIHVVVTLLITLGGFIPTFGQSHSSARVYVSGGVAIPNATLADDYHLRAPGYTISGRLSLPIKDSPINVQVLTSFTKFAETLTFRGLGTEEEQGGPFEHSMRFIALGVGAQYEFLQGQSVSPFVGLAASANFIQWRIDPPSGSPESPYTANARRVGLAFEGGVHLEVLNSPISLELSTSYSLANLIGKQPTDYSYHLQIADEGHEVDSFNYVAISIGIGISL